MCKNHGLLGLAFSAVLAGTSLLTAAEGTATKDSQAQRSRAFFPEIVKRGHVEGVRAAELIRPDLLAVTIDPAITRWGFGQGPAGDFQEPETFTVTSSTDASYREGVHPLKVGRRSFEYFNGVAQGPVSHSRRPAGSAERRQEYRYESKNVPRYHPRPQHE